MDGDTKNFLRDLLLHIRAKLTHGDRLATHWKWRSEPGITYRITGPLADITPADRERMEEEVAAFFDGYLANEEPRVTKGCPLPQGDFCMERLEGVIAVAAYDITQDETIVRIFVTPRKAKVIRVL